MKNIEILAAIFWTVIQLGVMVIRIIIYKATFKSFHLWFAGASFAMACWGLSLLGIHEIYMEIIHRIIIPPLASLLLFVATYRGIKNLTKYE